MVEMEASCSPADIRAHRHSEMGGPGEERKRRDMKRELQEWRQQQKIAKNDENAPYAHPNRCKLDGKQLGGLALSSPRTPSKHRGHVNAVSPLTEVCQNSGSAVSEARRCKAAVSPVFATQLAFNGLTSPAQVNSRSQAWTKTSPRSIEEERSVLRHSPETVEEMAKRTDVAQGCGLSVCRKCGQSIRHGGRRCGESEHECLCYCDSCQHASEQDLRIECSATASAVATEHDPGVFAELCTWEDSASLPLAPPSSPATPYVGILGRREEPIERLALQGFMLGLPASLHVALNQASPEPQQLLASLEQANEGQSSSASTSEALDMAMQAAEADREIDDVTEMLRRRTQRNLGVEQRDDSAIEIGDVEGSDQEDVGEASELDKWRHKIICHQPDWPAQPLLDMEDHLSRSFDIRIFWFFELRDRRDKHFGGDLPPAQELESIPEFPPSWSQWQIESARSRSAMRTRKQSPRKSGMDAFGGLPIT